MFAFHKSKNVALGLGEQINFQLYFDKVKPIL
jgi:hypothetical protein